MTAQFESFDPFIIIFSVPFAITDVLIGLLELKIQTSTYPDDCYSSYQRYAPVRTHEVVRDMKHLTLWVLQLYLDWLHPLLLP